MSGEPVASNAGGPKNSTHSRKARALLSQQSPSVEPPAPLTIVPPAPLTPAPLTIVPDLTRAQIVPPAPLTPAPLSIVPPGTIRWIIQDDGQGKLLVIDAYLVPGKLAQWAKMALSTFVFPTNEQWSPDKLINKPEDELAWASGSWPPGSLGEDAIVARVPAGTFMDVWAAAQGGNRTSRPRALAMALCIASALIQPLPERTDCDLKKVLGHNNFQGLVDEARAELDRAREAWRKKVQQAAEGEAPNSAEAQPGSGFLALATDTDGETAGSQGESTDSESQ